MPLQATSGAASYDGFGGGAAAVPQYIEEVFSTYLYTGNGATQTITNGIDLSTKGGLVWIKRRNTDAFHQLYDTARGVQQTIYTNATNAQTSKPDGLTAFNANGFSVGPELGVNGSGDSQVSWTFRKQPKFFDVVTWTGDSNNSRMLSHSLGSVPGCIITKCTSTTSNWFTWHRASGITTSVTGFQLNGTAAATTTGYDVSTNITSTQFRPAAIFDSSSNEPNVSGRTYVAYLFAHNAGGFGLTGTDNVISCGSYTGTGTDQSISLGFEPQWLLIKKSSGISDWAMFDNMRGATVLGVADSFLKANGSNAEYNAEDFVEFYADGFKVDSAQSSINGSGDTMIYIAIRRGPMKVPTLGTSVFSPVTYTGNGTSQAVTTGITGDLTYIKYRTDAGAATIFTDRLRGSSKFLESNSTAAEDTSAQHLTAFNQLGFSVGNNGNVNASGGTFISETFKRAPSFFDEVCYTGVGTAQSINHNLTVVPQLTIWKERSTTSNWYVYQGVSGNREYGKLNLTNTLVGNSPGWYSSVTATQINVCASSDNTDVNDAGVTYVVYLFATCPGVSKVFSYTGNGSSQTINCGFTGGARFVLIKSTDASGDWYVWDSARGIVAGNDPHLSLNTTAAEVTTDDSVDTDNTGFIVNQVAATNVNVTSATYIGIAIA